MDKTNKLIDIRREFTPHINPNDCWNLVLSRISGKDYDVIRKEMFESGHIDDVGLKSIFTSKILKEYYYHPAIELLTNETTIKDILINLYDYEVVIASFNLEKSLPHLSYAHKGVDYTTSEKDSSMDDPVLYIWVKFNKFLFRKSH